MVKNKNVRTVRTKVYKFAGLSEQAQARAIDDYRKENDDYPWQGDNIATLKAFMEIFPVESNRRGGVRFRERYPDPRYDVLPKLSGQRLATYLWNNYKDDLYKPKYYSRGNSVRHSKCQIEPGCVFTGYYMDNEMVKPLYDHMNKPDDRTNFEQLMSECFQAWGEAVEEDIKWVNSDAAIKETIINNEYEFYADGRQFSR